MLKIDTVKFEVEVEEWYLNLKWSVISHLTPKDQAKELKWDCDNRLYEHCTYVYLDRLIFLDVEIVSSFPFSITKLFLETPTDKVDFFKGNREIFWNRHKKVDLSKNSITLWGNFVRSGRGFCELNTDVAETNMKKI